MFRKTMQHYPFDKLSGIATKMIAINLKMTPTIKNFDSFTKPIRAIIQNNQRVFNAVNKVAEATKNWPERQKKYWVKAAELGWFVNWFTPLRFAKKTVTCEPAEFDKCMAQHIENDWQLLKDKILELCPDRAHILTVAFELHEQSNFIASIPLFFSQADGICAQHLGVFLFSDHKTRKEKINDIYLEKGTDIIQVLLEPLRTKTQFGERIGNSKPKHKRLAPNRNGILHGSRKHLDYGELINSFKSFSLLAFVAFVLVDSKNETDE